MEWLFPWVPVDALGPQFAATFEQVLKREVGPGHPLYGSMDLSGWGRPAAGVYRQPGTSLLE